MEQFVRGLLPFMAGAFTALVSVLTFALASYFIVAREESKTRTRFMRAVFENMAQQKQ